MTQRISSIHAFLAELKRRHVFRVAAVYGATSFVVVEAADLFFPRLGLPDWTVTLMVGLVLVGFPIALVLAWAFELTPEGVKRTEAADTDELAAIVAEPRSRRWLAGLAALVAIVLLFVAAWFSGGSDLVKRGQPDLPIVDAGRSAVAVLPFSVKASPELAYLQEGMVNLLSTKLDGAGDLRSVDPRTLLRYVEQETFNAGDPATARRIAARFGADLYVVGDLVEVGGKLQLAASLYDRGVGRGPISEGSVEGAVDDLFALVDELATELLSGLSGGPAARVRRIAAVTTASLPALKSFLEGEELFRRAQFGAAVEAFRRTTELDSTFALAHYRLSMVAEWNLQDELAREAAEQAVRYSQRLTDRDRRMLEAFLTRRRGANSEAEQLYRSILGTYPDEMEAWLDLAEVLFHAGPIHGRSFTASREALEKVLEFDPRHSTALIHLSRVEAYDGNYELLDSLVRRFMVLNPEPERTLEVEALRAFALRDESAMAATLERLRRAEDLGVALAVWATAVYARNLDGAENIAYILTEPQRSAEARRLGYAWRAYLKLARGKWVAAEEELDKLAEVDRGTALEFRALLSVIPFVPVQGEELQRLAGQLERLDPASVAVSDNPSIVFTAHDSLHPLIRLYLLGILEARLGATAAASRHADQLAGVEVPRTAGSIALDLAHSVRAQSLLSQDPNRAAEALAQLEAARLETWYGQSMASPLFGQVFERFNRAELLKSQGRDEEALRWYANLAETSPFELPYLAMAHRRRAEIYDRLGQPEPARQHFARFIELWQDADPELQPQVEAAQRRLEELALR